MLILAINQSGPPDHSTDARKYFAHVERFGDKVIGTFLKPHHLVDYVVLSSNHDDWHIRLRADRTDQVKPICAIQSDIKRDQIKPAGLYCTIQTVLIVRLNDLISISLKAFAQQSAHLCFIIYDENAVQRSFAPLSSLSVVHQGSEKEN